MKETTNMEKSTELEHSNGQTALHISVNFIIIIFMARVYILGQMPESMRENGELTKCTAKVHLLGPMAENMLANTPKTKRKVMVRREISPITIFSYKDRAPDGIAAMIPAVIIKDAPCPIPRSVICSPSHITKQEPEVIVITVMTVNHQPPPSRTILVPLAVLILCSETDIVND